MTSAPSIVPGVRSRPLSPAPAPVRPPPFALPGLHFAAAICWLALGAIGLVIVAPGLSHGDFLSPRVFAVVHAFTLGVITTTIFGALYQFLPMALGVATRSVRAGFVGLGLLVTGTAALVAGFWAWWPAVQGMGWLLLFGAIAVHSWNLSPWRAGPEPGRVIARYVAAGHTALGLALFLAGCRIGESLGWWTLDRTGTIAAHFHLAALGFASLTAVGVGSRMIPMFLISHGTPEWPLRWIAPLALIGLIVFTLGEVARWPSPAMAGAVLLVAAALLHLHLARGYFRRRLRRRLDPALAHVVAAFAGLGLTVVLGVALLATPGFHPRQWIAYGLVAVLGWLVPFLLGILYKLVAHLSWIHFYGRRTGADAITVQALLSPRLAWSSLGLLCAGLLTLVAGIFSGIPVLAGSGAAIWCAGALLVPTQYLRMLTR